MQNNNELVDSLMELTDGDDHLKKCLDTFLHQLRNKTEIEYDFEKNKDFWSRAYAINGIGLYYYIRDIIRYQVSLSEYDDEVRFSISEYIYFTFPRDMNKSNDFRHKIEFKQAFEKLCDIQKLSLSDLLTNIEKFLSKK